MRVYVCLLSLKREERQRTHLHLNIFDIFVIRMAPKAAPSKRPSAAGAKKDERSSPTAPSSRGNSPVNDEQRGATAESDKRRAPSSSGLRRSGSQRGQKGKGDSRKRREQLILEIVNGETLGRQTIAQLWTQEYSELQVRYEEDSKKTKDSYISVLERRLQQARLQATSRIDTMEEKFADVLQSLSRVLVDTYNIGAIGVTEGFLLSELPPSMQPQQQQQSPTQSPRLGSTQAPHQQPSARLVSPFAAGGGAAAITAAANSLAADNTEEKIRRFFVNPLSTSSSKLEVINAKELCNRLDDLRLGITGLVSQCVTKLSRSNHRVKDLEHALEEQRACLASAEKLLQTSLVRSSSSSLETPVQAAIQMCRTLGAEVKQKFDEQFDRLKKALDALIHQSVEVCMDRGAYMKRSESDTTRQLRRNMIKQELVADFMAEVDDVRLLQDELLRDIRSKLVELETKSLKTEPLQAAKLFRTNIPEGYRRILHCCDAAFDRGALLQLIDHVSFEPSVAEVVVAVVQSFVDAQGINDTEEIIAAHSTITKESQSSSAAASAVVSTTNAAHALVPHRPPYAMAPAVPPPQRSVVYAKALNSVAFGSGNSMTAVANHKRSAEHLHMKNDGVLSAGLRLSSAIQHLHASKDGNGASFSPLHSVPASEVVHPRLGNSADTYFQALLHPAAAGVVVPTSAMFVPPLVKMYVESETQKRMKLDATLHQLRNGDNSLSEAVKMEPGMSPAVKRHMLLDVLAEAEADETSSTSRRSAAEVFNPASAPRPTSSSWVGQNGELPSAARLFAEKQHSLLQDLLAAD